MSAIAVNHAVIAQLSGELRSAFEELERLNTQLKNQVDALNTTIWQGQDPAKDAFYRAHESFNQIFQKNHYALEALNGGVLNVSRAFNDAEEAGRRAFGSIG
ncbi:WXG100 family type VII secretion target [Gordonia aurantiaca]|uniref:WXG100 family type VII secretion target n=1 Tax=Gordonia sp. B21 TaxID=3151852 RepID=UPI0032647DDF